MDHRELNELLLNLSPGDRQAALNLLREHAWLLIPDVRCDMLANGTQGVVQGIKLGTHYEVDFVTYEIQGFRVHWQMNFIGSPSARILENGCLSRDFAYATEQVDCWRNSKLDWQNQFTDLPRISKFQHAFSYRIVIGQSTRQTDDERQEVWRCRRGDLRIRSYVWLLEKPTHYSPAQFAFLESYVPGNIFQI